MTTNLRVLYVTAEAQSLVKGTGSLADSVVNTTPRTLMNDTATGFVFENATKAELLACIMRALLLYQQQPAWQKIQAKGMRQDFSWEASAKEYLRVYQTLLPGS